MPNLKRFVGANKLSMQLIFIYIKAWIIQCCGAGFSWFYPILLIFSLAWLPAHVFSSQAGVTPAMIEKFKSLPDEQKKSMAEQFGIEFPMGGLDIPVEREIQIPVTLDQSRAVNFQEMVEEDEKIGYQTPVISLNYRGLAQTSLTPILRISSRPIIYCRPGGTR